MDNDDADLTRFWNTVGLSTDIEYMLWKEGSTMGLFLYELPFVMFSLDELPTTTTSSITWDTDADNSGNASTWIAVFVLLFLFGVMFWLYKSNGKLFSFNKSSASHHYSLTDVDVQSSYAPPLNTVRGGR